MKLFEILIGISALLGTLSANSPNEFIQYIGADNARALFTLKAPYSWLESIDYCQVNRMFAASIKSQLENDMVVQFLNNSHDFPSNGDFWLPATDFEHEGTFTWLQDGEPLVYSNWESGYPSMNRTRNCVVLKSNGKWIDEECSSRIYYYPLCQVPFLNQETLKKEGAPVPQDQFRVFTPPKQMLNVESHPASLIPIGGAGTKTYYKDNTLTMRKFHEILTYCHEFGMRAVTPENTEEEEFLLNYSLEMSQAGEDPTFLTAGTNLLTPSCTKTNSAFRWFYSGEEITNQDNFYHGTSWSRCVIITTDGFISVDCIGMLTWTMCELNSARH